MTVAEFEKAYDQADLLAAFNEMPLEFAGYQKPNNTLMPGLPGHSYWAERVRGFLAPTSAIWAGLDAISEAERSVLRRASVLTIECETVGAPPCRCAG